MQFSPKRSTVLKVALISLAVISIGYGAYAYSQPPQLQLRAGIIRGSGDVYPAARNTLIFSPYSLKEVISELKSINKMGLPPKPPEKNDKQFVPKTQVTEKPPEPDLVYDQFADNYPRPQMNEERFKTKCIYFEFTDETSCYTNFDAYETAEQQWQQSRNAAYQQAKARLSAWEQQMAQFEDAKEKAYQAAYQKYIKAYHAWIEKSETHLDELLLKKIAKRPIHRTRTDLDGRTQLRLATGKWFISGGNSSGLSTLFWNEVPFEMTRQSHFYELANDVAEVENQSYDNLKDEPEFKDLILGFNKTQKELDNELADVNYLLKNLTRYTILDLKNLDGWNILHMVAAAAPVPVRAELSHLLLLYGADPDLPDQNGKTPLHLSVEHNNRTTTMFLLAYGASLKAADHDAQTPLHLAIEKDLPEMVKLLLPHQPPLKQVNGKGQTPLEMAIALKREKIVPLLQQDKQAAASSKPSKATSSPQKSPSPHVSGKPTTQPTEKPAAKTSASGSPAGKSN